MFETHSAFKYPLQFGDKSVFWSAIELAVATPWFVATLFDPTELIERRFLLAREDEVLLFASEAPVGKLTALHLIQSPTWSPTGDWAVVPIRRVNRKQNESSDIVSLVLTDNEGTHYGGFPIKRLEGDLGSLELLIEIDGLCQR